LTEWQKQVDESEELLRGIEFVTSGLVKVRG